MARETHPYGKAVQELGLKFRPEVQEAQLPRSMMAFWLAMTSVLAALHFGSVFSQEFSRTTLAVALAPVILTWIVGFWLLQRQRGASRGSSSSDDDDALELSSNRTIA
eukprot:TRINITY_DN25409_c0_g1_i1.p1 TRINITY_DN25409_c0_g1~~TRINITY_DN25409_c0_g1_i1.p1  ORF type:complete len:108 (+),score=23.10 TRINITY_DN25409_c0_g1_i1:407-730(+)